MKKFTFLVVLIVVSIHSLGQPNSPRAALTKEEYLKKSKSQKTAAFILLGTGAIGLAIISGGDVDLGVVGPVFVVGTLAVLGSIPLFIASGRNKRKARTASVGFNVQKFKDIQYANVIIRYNPTLSIKIHL